MKELFARVPTPVHHRRHAIAQNAGWYSWSPAALRFVESHLDRIRALPAPRRVDVQGCAPYSVSYSYPLSALPPALVAFALEAGDALMKVDSGGEITFFAGMMDAPLSSSLFHKSLALIRSGIARIRGDARTALYAPVKTERVDSGFPLHADLFITERLWLIFDRVSNGTDGKSLFLSRPRFDALVRSSRSIPPETRRTLRDLMDGKCRGDRFEECFDLIYGERRPWTTSLTKAMKRESWAIRFRRGEGYLLNDRRWLHGRTAVKGSVLSNRFRRLIYGTVMT